MKKISLITTCLFFAFCTKKEHPIVGLWNVQSNYYKATFKIASEKNKLVGKVIYYNDDTTILHETRTEKDIFLFNLKETDNNTYIDAVSGATETKKHTTSISIKHKDTLEVTTYISKKPLTETWIRNKKLNTDE